MGLRIRKVASVLLTAIISYQAYYMFKASEEMGGKYADLDHVLYGWVSLLPAIALGSFAIRLAFAGSSEETSKLLEGRCLYDICAVVYVVVAAIMTAVFFYTKVHVQHQNPGYQYIHSKWSSMNWNVYYFGVLQYGPSIVLTCLYRRITKKAMKCKGKKAHCDQLKQAAVPVLSPDVKTTVYDVNLMT